MDLEDEPQSARKAIIDDTKDKLGIKESKIPFYATSARTGEGVDELAKGIASYLEKSGKDLLWAKITKHKDKLADGIIWRNATGAFGIGVIPIPGPDIIPLTALQVRMIIKIAQIYGKNLSKDDVMFFITNVAVGRLGKTIFRQLVKFAGDFFGIFTGGLATVITSGIAGFVAASMTYGLGKAAKIYYANDLKTPIPDLIAIYKDATKEKINWKKESLPLEPSE
jgi:GTP-binding protein Era